MSRIFTILGDSNVKRNISKTNARACPQMSGSQFLACPRLQLLEDVLGKVRKESDICIISCVTNFLTSSEEDSMVSKRVEPVVEEFAGTLANFASKFPAVSILVSPPMYRKSPVWYREGLPEILTRFSGAFRDRPDNLNLLPSFATPDFDPDGVHLTAYSGLEYMIHLFDSSLSVLESLSKTCDERIPEANESTRLLEDRVMVLEQDHRRLNRSVELKAANDAEVQDYHENVSNEAFIMITGCDRIIGLTTKEWQDRARKDIGKVLKELMGRDIPIEYVSNATGPRPDAPVRYNAKLSSVAVSKEVRDKFGSFYANGRDLRPPFFKPYSIRNLITQASRVRLAILQVIARRYRDSNPGSKVQVSSYGSRPSIRIIPGQDASSRRAMNLLFVEAVLKFPTNFNKTELEFILSKVGYKQKGLLRSLFICISDDMLSAKRFDRPKKGSAPAGASGSATGSNTAGDADADDDASMSEADSEAHVGHQPPAPAPEQGGSGGSGRTSRAEHANISSGTQEPGVIQAPTPSRGGQGRSAPKRGPPSPASVLPEKTSRV